VLKTACLCSTALSTIVMKHVITSIIMTKRLMVRVRSIFFGVILGWSKLDWRIASTG